jgi:XTP/dITP diphosphohydrolase
MNKDKSFLIATHNYGKTNELRKMFDDSGLKFDLKSLKELGITVDYEETGKTFADNAIGKSIFYGKMFSDSLTIADDSGLSVKALNGKPGVYSARYSGLAVNDERNIEKLLRNLKNIEDRNAEFITIIALSLNGKLIQTFEGRVKGIILNEKRGTGGFGYDPIFYYPPQNKTFAELTVKEKNNISHRAKAFQKLIEYLIKNY